jgi:hypothetical protein
MEYWNDLHQEEFHGMYNLTKEKIHKLGAEQRSRRAQDRGIDYIVCPVKYFFYDKFEKYFGGQTEKILIHFPHAPNLDGFKPKEYGTREPVVLGNGATWGGYGGGYDFRDWAFKQPYVKFVKHYVEDKGTPMGKDYLEYLANHMAALALCTIFPVPKYIEMPAAGCLTFAEYHKEYEELGFKDYEHCIYVNKESFEERVKEFLHDPLRFHSIAKRGDGLVKDNYTAQHFARKIEQITKEGR